MVEEMVHSELKRKSLRDESDAKSVKSNELFVNISNEYLFQSSAEEEKILDKNTSIPCIAVFLWIICRSIHPRCSLIECILSRP